MGAKEMFSLSGYPYRKTYATTILRRYPLYALKRGGKHLFLDEVHKYPSWSQEIKNIYDDFPGLKVVFTGSSLLEILNARADLSCRAVVYHMQGLSFREYLAMYHKVDLEVVSLDQVLTDHVNISARVLEKVKPLKFFPDYLKNGYYPFYLENPTQYYQKIEKVVNMVLEIELPLLRGVDMAYVQKLKQLLQIISSSAPFVPNTNKLSERIGIARNTLLSYLFYLDEVKLVNALYKDSDGIVKLQKPDKLFLENTNLAYALAPDNTEAGNMRETFFINQLGYTIIGSIIQLNPTSLSTASSLLRSGAKRRAKSRSREWRMPSSCRMILNTVRVTRFRCGCSGCCISNNFRKANISIDGYQTALFICFYCIEIKVTDIYKNCVNLLQRFFSNIDLMCRRDLLIKSFR